MLAVAIRAVSTDAFHLAMVVAAALLAAGATVNLVGLGRRRHVHAAPVPTDRD